MDAREQIRRYFKGWIEHDADAVLASLGDGGTYEDPGTRGPIAGEALRGYMGGLWSAFPDLGFEEESCGEIAPNRFAAQWIMRGTNTGSMMGLPSSGKPVELRGVDVFTVADDGIRSVTGYFDSAALPRQLGLNVIVQPVAIGPFRFGVATMVQTGRTVTPGAFAITHLEARDDAAVEKVREGTRAALIDMLKMDGFIGATTCAFGHRMVTISAWDDTEAPRRVMSEGAHARVMHGMSDGTLAEHGFTSVWAPQRINPELVRCPACGRMNRGPDDTRRCSQCGEALPAAAPYW